MSFFVFETDTHVAQASPKLCSSCFRLPDARILGMGHRNQLSRQLFADAFGGQAGGRALVLVSVSEVRGRNKTRSRAGALRASHGAFSFQTLRHVTFVLPSEVPSPLLSLLFSVG